MKKFLINIYAYDYHGRFEVESNDDAYFFRAINS